MIQFLECMFYACSGDIWSPNLGWFQPHPTGPSHSGLLSKSGEGREGPTNSWVAWYQTSHAARIMQNAKMSTHSVTFAMMFYWNFRKFNKIWEDHQGHPKDNQPLFSCLQRYGQVWLICIHLPFSSPFYICAWAKTSRTRATPTGRGAAMACNELRTEQSLSMIWQSKVLKETWNDMRWLKVEGSWILVSSKTLMNSVLNKSWCPSHKLSTHVNVWASALRCDTYAAWSPRWAKRQWKCVALQAGRMSILVYEYTSIHENTGDLKTLIIFGASETNTSLSGPESSLPINTTQCSMNQPKRHPTSCK